MRSVRAPHCTLEPQIASHAHEMFEVLSDPVIYEFESQLPPSEAGVTDRYSRLQSRTFADGTEKWLNWVIRLPDGQRAGHVQATVLQSSSSQVAYELASRHWRRGIGSSAVQAMLGQLNSIYGVHTFVAVLKAANYHSLDLLRRLGFSPASPEQLVKYGAEPDEVVMVKPSVKVQNAA